MVLLNPSKHPVIDPRAEVLPRVSACFLFDLAAFEILRPGMQLLSGGRRSAHACISTKAVSSQTREVRDQGVSSVTQRRYQISMNHLGAVKIQAIIHKYHASVKTSADIWRLPKSLLNSFHFSGRKIRHTCSGGHAVLPALQGIAQTTATDHGILIKTASNMGRSI